MSGLVMQGFGGDVPVRIGSMIAGVGATVLMFGRQRSGTPGDRQGGGDDGR